MGGVWGGVEWNGIQINFHLKSIQEICIESQEMQVNIRAYIVFYFIITSIFFYKEKKSFEEKIN